MSKIIQIPAPLNFKVAEPPPPPPVITNKSGMVDAEKAASGLMGAFDWGESAEGGEFWSAVYNRLLQISHDGVIKER